MVLQKRLRIISLVNKRNARYIKKTQKFGIKVPKSVAQAYALDKNNGSNLWENVISTEIKDVSPAFLGKTLTGYKKGRPLPVRPRMGHPPSSAPQNQTSTSTWNSTSYT